MLKIAAGPVRMGKEIVLAWVEGTNVVAGFVSAVKMFWVAGNV